MQAPDKKPARAVKATFAGGCFWCMEPPFDKLPGVLSTTSGYMGGKTKNPTYEQVSSGTTGHAEAVQVLYDPKKVSYATAARSVLAEHRSRRSDGQFCDHGSQYRTAIFFHDEDQRKLAEASKRPSKSRSRSKAPIVTQIVAAPAF